MMCSEEPTKNATIVVQVDAKLSGSFNDPAVTLVHLFKRDDTAEQIQQRQKGDHPRNVYCRGCDSHVLEDGVL
jgi:hypothetical protein